MSTLLSIFRDHVAWRHQIFKLAKSDLVKTYSGAALGWAWTIVKPTITILVFWFAFAVGLRLGGDIEGCPYILWLVAGYIPWFFMSDMFSGGAGAIRKYSYLVTKMKFPVATIPSFYGLSKLAVHAVLMCIVLLLYALFGRFPDIYLLQLPVYMLLMLLFFVTWALFSGMLSSMSKDFLNLVKSLTMALFWMSGIMWDINKIDHTAVPWLKTVLMFNPVTFVATGYRNVFVYKVWFWEEPKALLCFAGVFALVIVFAIWAYRKLLKEIPDVL